jgi:hypothetical protein
MDVLIQKVRVDKQLNLIHDLKATRKEDNWKTEETLARAVVTLETEWIKGPILYVYDDDDYLQACFS